MRISNWDRDLDAKQQQGLIRLQSCAYIPSLLVAQAIAAFFFDFRQFHNVLVFNFITVATPVPLYFLDSMLGFRSSEPATVSQSAA